MKKIGSKWISIGIILSLFYCGILVELATSTTTEIPDTYNQEYPGPLKYTILDKNETAEHFVEWTIYDPLTWEATMKGKAYTNISGWIIVNFTAFDGNVPVGNISIYKPDGSKNFSLEDVPNTEMANILTLSMYPWMAGFWLPIDWDSNANDAIVAANGLPGTSVKIKNTSNTVTYEFTQTSGFMQNTTLTYRRTDGVLIEATTKSSTYFYFHIKLEGTDKIPGFGFYTILAVGLISIIFLTKKSYIVRKK